MRVEGKEGGRGQLVRKLGRREAGAESFIEVYIYTPRAKRKGAGGKIWLWLEDDGREEG